MDKTRTTDTTLDRWLKQRGLSQNPFAVWNAELDHDLPGYFVDVGGFDDLLHRTEPCVVLARRGCGKTAQRQMLAAQCRPSVPGSPWLAIPYTYTAFQQALALAQGDVARLKDSHYADALVRQGTLTLAEEASRDPGAYSVLNQAPVASSWQAYLNRYASHLVDNPHPAVATRLDGQATGDLLQGFVRLLQAVGIERLLVLVDGLDELAQSAVDPNYMAALLAPLLGTLPLIEFPGLAFKFFLPQEAEATLRGRGWFRPDRLRIFRIKWRDIDLQNLIGQRLTYFSIKGDRAYKRLGQLCQDGLAETIDRELARLAGGLPRAALILADMLLQAHCRRPEPANRIALESWSTVKAQWTVRQAEFFEADQVGFPVQEANKRDLLSSTEWPRLVVDEKAGCVWKGAEEVLGIRTQEYHLLAALYRNSDRVCSHDLLVREAWPDTPDGVTEQAVAASIARLRKRLGQKGTGEGYIETAARRGYRLHPGGFSKKPV